MSLQRLLSEIAQAQSEDLRLQPRLECRNIGQPAAGTAPTAQDFETAIDIVYPEYDKSYVRAPRCTKRQISFAKGSTAYLLESLKTMVGLKRRGRDVEEMPTEFG